MNSKIDEIILKKKRRRVFFMGFHNGRIIKIVDDAFITFTLFTCTSSWMHNLFITLAAREWKQ